MASFARPALKVAAFTAVGAGVGYSGYKHWQSTHFFFNEVHAESLPSDSKAALKKVDWKGFTELKLVSAEQYNHNVKKLTFALPDDQSITGLSPISEFDFVTSLTLFFADWR